MDARYTETHNRKVRQLALMQTHATLLPHLVNAIENINQNNSKDLMNITPLVLIVEMAGLYGYKSQWNKKIYEIQKICNELLESLEEKEQYSAEDWPGQVKVLHKIHGDRLRALAENDPIKISEEATLRGATAVLKETVHTLRRRVYDEIVPVLWSLLMSLKKETGHWENLKV